MTDDRVAIRLAPAAEVIDLRHRVLRAGMPREAAMFENDALPDAFHVVAVDGDRVVCCATFHPSTYDDKPAWQLRGMATDATDRNRGLGRRVLEAAERVIWVRPMGDAGLVHLLWANARLGAMDFYKSVGWSIASELFDIPTAGPHYKIRKRLLASPFTDPTGRLDTRPDGPGE